MTEKIFELLACVRAIKYQKGGRGIESLTLSVEGLHDPDGACAAGGEGARLICGPPGELFFPVRRGDSVHAMVVAKQQKISPTKSKVTYALHPGGVGSGGEDFDEPSGEYVMPPRIVIPETLDRIRAFLTDLGNMNNNKIDLFMNLLTLEARKSACAQSRAGGEIVESDVFIFMCEEAAKLATSVQHHESRDVAKQLSKYERVTLLARSEMARVFTSFYRDIVLRLFYVAGLTKADILKCCTGDMTIMRAYQILYSNPYKLLKLTIPKCEQVCALLRIELREDVVEAASIARAIVAMTERNRDSAVSGQEAMDELGENLTRHAKNLSEYGIVYDQEVKCLYQRTQLEAEKFLGSWIARMSRAAGPFAGTEVGNAIEQLKRCPENLATLASEGANATSAFAKELQNLREDQRRAVLGACSHGFCVLSGRGGTGKTTVIGTIVRQFEAMKIPYALCSFTGKAVTRIHAAVGRPAYTIHSILKKNMSFLPTSMDTEPKMPVAIVIDEISMVTTELVYLLLRRVPKLAMLVVVGDMEQLPTIDAGAFMREVLASRVPESEDVHGFDREKRGVSVPNAPGERVPLYHLTENARAISDDGFSALHANVSAINEMPELFSERFHFQTSKRFKVLNGEMRALVDLLRKFRAQGIDVEKLGIVTPYNATTLAVNALVREIMFPETMELGAEEVTSHGEKWFVGARVMHLRNNHTHEVMNGEEGIIVDFVKDYANSETLIVVEYEDFVKSRARPHSLLVGFTPTYITPARRAARPVRYIAYANRPDEKNSSDSEASIALDFSPSVLEKVLKGSDEKEKTTRVEPIHAGDIDISFCATVHKYQGSERDHIIAFFPSHAANARMITREIVNVAITRARKSVTVIGNINDVERGACVPSPARLANLKWQIARAFEREINK